MPMPPEIKAAWGEWLLANADKQGTGKLHRGDGNEASAENEYCCLGGLCELAVAAGIAKRIFFPATRVYGYGEPGSDAHDVMLYSHCTEVLPAVVTRWARLTSDNPLVTTVSGKYTLAALNDGRTPFTEIWKLIDSQL